MNKIKKELAGETSPVQLRPDDLALILTWFGKASDDEAVSFGQQIEFGFSTGDEQISEAYFYITSSPLSEKFMGTNLLQKVHLNHNGFQGMVLLYDDLLKSEN